MIKKVSMLGNFLDCASALEEIMCVEQCIGNNMLTTMETISMKMLLDSENDSMIKDVINSLDFAVIGEKEIAQAAGVYDTEQKEQIEQNLFFHEFFQRMEQGKKTIFLLGETEEKIDKAKANLLERYPLLQFAGEYAIEKCVGDLEAVINDMNATTPNVIVSVLPSPMQERFLAQHKEKMNANLWYGIGGMVQQKKKHFILGGIKRKASYVKLKNSMKKYKE